MNITYSGRSWVSSNASERRTVLCLQRLRIQELDAPKVTLTAEIQKPIDRGDPTHVHVSSVRCLDMSQTVASVADTSLAVESRAPFDRRFGPQGQSTQCPSTQFHRFTASVSFSELEDTTRFLHSQRPSQERPVSDRQQQQP